MVSSIGVSTGQLHPCHSSRLSLPFLKIVGNTKRSGLFDGFLQAYSFSRNHCQGHDTDIQTHMFPSPPPPVVKSSQFETTESSTNVDSFSPLPNVTLCHRQKESDSDVSQLAFSLIVHGKSNTQEINNMNSFCLDKTKRCAQFRHILHLTKRQTDRQITRKR